MLNNDCLKNLNNRKIEAFINLSERVEELT